MNPADLTDRVAYLLGRSVIRAEQLTIERDRLKARVAELERAAAERNGTRVEANA